MFDATSNSNVWAFFGDDLCLFGEGTRRKRVGFLRFVGGKEIGGL